MVRNKIFLKDYRSFKELDEIDFKRIYLEWNNYPKVGNGLGLSLWLQFIMKYIHFKFHWFIIIYKR